MKLLSPFYWCINCSWGEKLKRFAWGHISFLRAQSLRAPSPMDILIKTNTGTVLKLNSRSCWSWGICEEKQITHIPSSISKGYWWEAGQVGALLCSSCLSIFCTSIYSETYKQVLPNISLQQWIIWQPTSLGISCSFIYLSRWYHFLPLRQSASICYNFSCHDLLIQDWEQWE